MSEYYQIEGIGFVKNRSQKAIEEMLSNKALGELRVIECDGVAVGYYCLVYGYSLENCGRDCCLEELYIEPAHRNRGIGTEALKRIEAHLARERFKAIYLEVYDSNPGAYSFYLKNGYVRHAASFMTKILPAGHAEQFGGDPGLG
jgi:GNAT superfamily N-acetyltransferase